MIINEKYITDIDDEDDDNAIDSNSFNYTNDNKNDDFDDKLILCFNQVRNASANTTYNQETIDSIYKINDLIIDILDEFDMFDYSEDFEYYTSHMNFQYCQYEIKIDDRLVIHTQRKYY